MPSSEKAPSRKNIVTYRYWALRAAFSRAKKEGRLVLASSAKTACCTGEGTRGSEMPPIYIMREKLQSSPTNTSEAAVYTVTCLYVYEQTESTHRS